MRITQAEIDDLERRSKDDYLSGRIVGSEVRQLIEGIKELTNELAIAEKKTREAEDRLACTDTTERDNFVSDLVCDKLLEAMADSNSHYFAGPKLNQIVEMYKAKVFTSLILQLDLSAAEKRINRLRLMASRAAGHFSRFPPWTSTLYRQAHDDCIKNGDLDPNEGISE